MKNKIEELEDEITYLKEKIEELEDDLSDERYMRERAEEEVSDYEKQIEELEESRDLSGFSGEIMDSKLMDKNIYIGDYGYERIYITTKE